jgi:nucleotide-binding universal stress UspA family protein
MLNIKKILLPVDFPDVSLPVIHQAAILARHFNAEILMLHAVTPLSHAAGVPDHEPELARWDLLAEINKRTEKNTGQSLRAELNGLRVQSVVATGDPAHAIVEGAQRAKADLIMMPSHGAMFDQFLMGSVTAKVLHRTECPVWTGAHAQEPPAQEFAIRNVLCAVDFGLRTEQTVSWAKQMAVEFGAQLTLAHVTAGVESWGPGGSYVNQEWKDALVGDATRRLAELQQASGTKAEVFIGSGDVPKV